MSFGRGAQPLDSLEAMMNDVTDDPRSKEVIENPGPARPRLRAEPSSPPSSILSQGEIARGDNRLGYRQ